MTETKRSFRFLIKPMMLMVPILIGGMIFILMSRSRKPPAQKEMVINPPTVRTMEIQPIEVIPRAIGYGTSQPIRTWKAVAQVSGKIIFAHPQLQKGNIIKQGTELLKIDQTEYKINITKLTANIQNFEIQIAQKKVEKNNLGELLALQKTDLKIKRQETERQRELFRKKIISKTEYEKQLQSFISQEVQVQNIQNSLNLIPAQTELLQTQLDQARGDLESARIKLSYTRITAPFDIQIASVNNKLSEYVQTGQTILEANDISETEVEAQFVMKATFPLFHSVRARTQLVKAETVSIGEVLGISAMVRLAGVEVKEAKWKASLNRRSDTLDTQTRTVGLIVSVKNRVEEGPGRGKLLLKGAYCEVELQGQPQKNAIAIPRVALHPNNTVYIVNQDQKLVKKQVEVLYPLSDFIVIRKGLQAGERLILTDLIPAVEGMKVNPVPDEQSLERLIRDARGEAL